jgi:Aspartyl protease/Domain of unknown function (DUF4124)
MYRWTDEEGTTHYTMERERVPERYRAAAEAISVPSGPRSAERESSAGPPGTATIPFTPGAPILVKAMIDGAGPITLVLDTGADLTMVAPAALQRLGIAIQPSVRAHVRGVTGATQADAVWVKSVEVGSAAVGPLLLVAHDAGLTQADGLLGRDFLGLFTVTLDAAAHIVTLLPR